MAAAAAAVVAHHHLLLSRPSPFLPKLLLSSSCIRILPTSFPLRFFSTRSPLCHFHTPSSSSSSSLLDNVLDEDEHEYEESQQQQQSTAAAITDSIRTAVSLPISSSSSSSSLPLPNLSIKEKKELASYAHSLGKKLKCQQVGKSGVTPAAAAAFVENLESNELLKLKVHNSCPGELADVVKQLEELTGSIAVGQIGRSVILYRPSLTKLKAAEKKKQNAERVRKFFALKSKQPKVQVMRSPRGGHSGGRQI